MYQTAFVYETATRLLYNTILCTIYMIPQILPRFEKTSQKEIPKLSFNDNGVTETKYY